MKPIRFMKHFGLVLTLLMSGLSFSLAEVTVRDCDPEPTDMTIAYGEFLTGSNCVISGGGEVDLFRFNGSAGDWVLLSLGDGSSVIAYNPCFEVRDPSMARCSFGFAVHVELPPRVKAVCTSCIGCNGQKI